jgi:hypothetical protein
MAVTLVTRAPFAYYPKTRRDARLKEKLQIKPEDSANDSISCPGCGKPLAVGSIICVECGYDMRSRRRIRAAGERMPSPIVLLGVLIGALAAAAVLYVRWKNDGTHPAPPPATAAQPPAAITEHRVADSPADAAPAGEAPASVEPATATAEATVTETSAEPASSGVNAESAAENTEEDWAELAARHLARLRAEADRRSPMFELGKAVELRLTNGLVRRGIFRGLDGSALLLEAEERESIPLDKLDRNTRLRVDSAYRERYLEYLTRQRIAEMRRARERAINATPGGG